MLLLHKTVYSDSDVLGDFPVVFSQEYQNTIKFFFCMDWMKDIDPLLGCQFNSLYGSNKF